MAEGERGDSPMKREVDSSGNCNKCGGVHYGSYKCPYTDAQVEAMCSSDLSAGSAEPSSTSTITKQLGEATESQLTSISTTAGTATSDSRSSAPSPEELARSREKWVEIAKNLLWDSVVLQPAIMDFDEVVAQMADYMQSGYAALLRSRMERAERWIPVGEMLPESDGWYQIYPVDVNNPANPKDLPFSFEYWLRREQERCGKGWCGCNTATHWRPLPSAPDTEPVKK